MHLSAEAVSELLLCEVGSAVETVSKRHAVTPEVGRDVWRQWRRRLKGECPGCGRKVEGDTCVDCKSMPLDTRDMTEVLERISKNTILMRCTCLDCYKEIPVTADTILSAVQRFGKFYAPKLCRDCKWPNKPLTHKPFMNLRGRKAEK